MKKLIELHDSRIESVEIKGNILNIKLNPMIVLHVTDAFGFEFEKTEYCEGIIQIHNFSSENQVSPEMIFDGYLQVEECQYPLIPVGFNIAKKKCVLFLTGENGENYIFGDKVTVQILSS